MMHMALNSDKVSSTCACHTGLQHDGPSTKFYGREQLFFSGTLCSFPPCKAQITKIKKVSLFQNKFCPDEPLHISNTSVYLQYVEKAFSESPFH